MKKASDIALKMAIATGAVVPPPDLPSRRERLLAWLGWLLVGLVGLGLGALYWLS